MVREIVETPANQVVDHANGVPAIQEQVHHMAADEAGPTRDEHTH
jgi:hypothetical protein